MTRLTPGSPSRTAILQRSALAWVQRHPYLAWAHDHFHRVPESFRDGDEVRAEFEHYKWRYLQEIVSGTRQLNDAGLPFKERRAAHGSDGMEFLSPPECAARRALLRDLAGPQGDSRSEVRTYLETEDTTEFLRRVDERFAAMDRQEAQETAVWAAAEAGAAASFEVVEEAGGTLT